MSNFIIELLDKLGAESRKLQSHSSVVHEAQAITIADFQKAYEVCFQQVESYICHFDWVIEFWAL